MGCDIHMFVETRSNSKWEKVGRVFKNPYWNDSSKEIDEDGYYFGPLTDEPYRGRNYGLFGILAGVRWAEVKPIAPARGVPEGASGEYREIVERYGADGHSHSWLTLRELVEFDRWMLPVSVESDYDDPVWGKRFELAQANRDHSSMGELSLIIPKRLRLYSDIAGNFYSETIPLLLDLAPIDDVRIVFFFDN